MFLTRQKIYLASVESTVITFWKNVPHHHFKGGGMGEHAMYLEIHHNR
jgi:hypothetical protein